MDYVQNYFDRYMENLRKIDSSKVEGIVRTLYRAWQNDNRVFIVGNGGSASTASHMACDLGKGTLDNVYDSGIKRFQVISLTDNVATISAIGNDLGYENIFTQQLLNVGKPGDVLLIITGSGNSTNVIKAAEAANSLGMTTIGLLGFDGGKIRKVLDDYIIFEESHYGRVEDFHLMLNHIITERLSQLMRESR